MPGRRSFLKGLAALVATVHVPIRFPVEAPKGFTIAEDQYQFRTGAIGSTFDFKWREIGWAKDFVVTDMDGQDHQVQLGNGKVYLGESYFAKVAGINKEQTELTLELEKS